MPSSKGTKRRPTAVATKRSKTRATRRRPTLAELNSWLAAHHGELLDAARQNCVRLTGKPTFGAAHRRKSA